MGDDWPVLVGRVLEQRLIYTVVDLLSSPLHNHGVSRSLRTTGGDGEASLLRPQQEVTSLSPHFCCHALCFSHITHPRGSASQVTVLLSWGCCCCRRTQGGEGWWVRDGGKEERRQ